MPGSFARFFQQDDASKHDEDFGDTEEEYQSESVAETEEEEEDVETNADDANIEKSDISVSGAEEDTESLIGNDSVVAESVRDAIDSESIRPAIDFAIGMLLLNSAKPVARPVKGRRKDGGPVRAVEKVLRVIKNADGRFVCPISGCNKDFKVSYSFKYHHCNFRHSICALLGSTLEKLEHPEAENSDMLTTVKAALDLAMKNDLFVKSSEFGYTFDDTDVLYTADFSFDSESKARFSTSVALSASQNVIAATELNTIQRLVDLAVQQLLTLRPKKRLSARAKHLVEFNAPDDQQLVLYSEFVNSKFKCPIPDCDKEFSTQPSIKYHFENHQHNLMQLLLRAETFMSLLTEVERESLKNLAGFLEANAGENVFASRSFLYHWPTLDSAFECNPKFGVISSVPVTKRAAEFCPLPQAKRVRPSTSISCFEADITLIDPIEGRNVSLSQVSSSQVQDLTISGHSATAFCSGTQKGFLLNTSGFVTAACWLSTEGDEQYIACAVQQDLQSPCSWKKQACHPGTIQIWKVDSALLHKSTQVAVPVLLMQLSHDFGSVFDMQICPASFSDQGPFGSLGLLAASFSDGTIAVFSVPRVDKVRLKFCIDSSRPICMKMLPIFTQRLKEGTYTKLSWSLNTAQLAAGTSFGNVVVWNAEDFSLPHAVPVASIPVHDFQVSSLAWCNSQDFIIASAGFDGKVCFTDTRDIGGKSTLICRLKEYCNSIVYNEAQGSMFICQDSLVKQYMDGSMASQVLTHEGVLWGVSASEHHGTIAACSYDGVVKVSDTVAARARGGQPAMTNLFTMRLDEESKISLVKGSGKKEKLKTKGSVETSFHSSGCYAVGLAWNPEARHSKWLLTALKQGILRLEMVESIK